MLRVKPQYIDRHSQMRNFSIRHKNKRWNTNVTDHCFERPGDVYEKEHVHGIKPTEGLPSSEIPFSQLPAFSEARNAITRLGNESFKNDNLKDLCCELNFYFGEGGIGYHGDSERALVFGGSIGTENRIIEWCRFQKSKPYADPETGKWEVYRLTLKPGDAYVMSEFAAGCTWSTEKSKVTIRHRAGNLAFLQKQKVKNGKDESGKPILCLTIAKNGKDASNFHSTDYSVKKKRKRSAAEWADKEKEVIKRFKAYEKGKLKEIEDLKKKYLSEIEKQKNELNEMRAKLKRRLIKYKNKMIEAQKNN